MFKTKWHTGLRVKLTLWAFTPTLIIFSVALLTFTAYQRATEDLAIERNLDLVRLLAEQLASELDGSVQSLEDAAQQIDLDRSISESSAEILSIVRTSGAGFDAGAMLFDENGILLAIDPAQSIRLGEDWSVYDWFSTTSAAFSKIEPLGANNSDVIAITVPIRNERLQVIGVIGGMFYVPSRSFSNSMYASIDRGVASSNIPEDIIYVTSQGRVRPISELSAPARLFQHSQTLRLGLSESSELYVVDSSGAAIYHTDSRSIGHDLSTSSIVQQALVSSFGAIRTENLVKEEVVATYTAVGSTGWHLLAEESWDSINAFSYGYRVFLQATLVVGLLLPVLLVSGAMKRITRVITNIIEAARQVAGGNFGRVIETKTGDELDDLAVQFNTMSTRLKESYSDLEKRVHDRTRDLATLNKIARVTGESLSLQTILDSALHEILKTLDFSAGQAEIWDADTQTSIISVHCGQWQQAYQEAMGRDWAQELYNTTEGSYQPRLLHQHVDNQTEEAPQTDIIIVPVTSDERLLGTMGLCNKSSMSLSQEEMDLLAAIGRQVGLAVDKALLSAKAQELAIVQERNRLARDLHDSVTQSLYAITFYSQAAERLVKENQNDKAAKHIRQVSEASQNALREMRLLLLDLRPPDIESDGLVSALQKRLDAVEGRSGLVTRLQVLGQEPESPQIVDTLYRIASEALNNALKHSEATQLVVLLDFREKLEISITDNGIGFDLQKAQRGVGMGLVTMRERAASIGAHLYIQSQPGSGTTITVEVDS